MSRRIRNLKDLDGVSIIPCDNCKIRTVCHDTFSDGKLIRPLVLPLLAKLYLNYNSEMRCLPQEYR